MVETPQSGATRGHRARLGEGVPGYAGRTLRLTLGRALALDRAGQFPSGAVPMRFQRAGGARRRQQECPCRRAPCPLNAIIIQATPFDLLF